MILPEFLVEHSDGEIRLTGHRIGLYTIVRDYKKDMTAEQIAEEYPSLDLDHVRKVIGFYLANRVEVDAYVDEYRKELEPQEKAYAPSPEMRRIGRLMDRLREGDAAHAADPEWNTLDSFEKLRRLGVSNPREA